jgi:hypothetical protein
MGFNKNKSQHPAGAGKSQEPTKSPSRQSIASSRGGEDDMFDADHLSLSRYSTRVKSRRSSADRSKRKTLTN